MDHDEVESVPWGELLQPQPQQFDFRRIAYMVAGLLGAVVVGATMARTWWNPGTPTVIAPGAALTADAGPAASAAPPVTTTAAAPLYSEADLMADPIDPAERSAVARAEWFVTDYFTADYEPTGSGDIRAALPGAADLPAMPQDGSGGISYVEWARAFEIGHSGDGMYLISVAFRTLAAPPDGAFIRLPVRAVDVLIDVSESGASVVDLPRPRPLPVGPEPAAWPEPGADPPSEVVDLAAARASVWGSEPRIVSAAAVETGWRIVLTVADDVGNRWPLSMVVPS